MFNKTATTEKQPLSTDVLDYIRSLPKPERGNISLPVGGSIGRAVDLADMHLRYNPDQPLAEVPVYLTGNQRGNFRAQVLQTMINASITRPVENSDPTFACTVPAAVDTCGQAEGFFLDTIDNLNSEETDWVDANIITNNGSPVLITKLMGIRTCLTLCDIRIDGIPYPAGSIARPRLYTDAGKVIRRGPSRYIEYDISEVQSLGFIRLSQFAIPSSQRTRYDNDEELDYRVVTKNRKITAKKIALEVKKILNYNEK